MQMIRVSSIINVYFNIIKIVWNSRCTQTGQKTRKPVLIAFLMKVREKMQHGLIFLMSVHSISLCFIWCLQQRLKHHQCVLKRCLDQQAGVLEIYRPTDMETGVDSLLWVSMATQKVIYRATIFTVSAWSILSFDISDKRILCALCNLELSRPTGAQERNQKW